MNLGMAEWILLASFSIAVLAIIAAAVASTRRSMQPGEHVTRALARRRIVGELPVSQDGLEIAPGAWVWVLQPGRHWLAVEVKAVSLKGIFTRVDGMDVVFAIDQVWYDQPAEVVFEQGGLQ